METRVCIAIVGAILLTPSGAWAGRSGPTPPPSGGGANSRIGSGGAPNDNMVAVAWNSTDDTLLYVWRANDTTGSCNGSASGAIRGHLRNASDLATGGTPGFFTIAGNADGTGTMVCPTVAYNSVANRFMVSWTENVGGTLVVRVQELTNAGAPYGAAATVSANVGVAARHGIVRFNPGTADYLVAYNQLSGSKASYTMMCKGHDAAELHTCTNRFTNVLVNEKTSFDYPGIGVRPGIAGVGTYLLVWQSGAGTTVSRTIGGVLLNTDLSPTVVNPFGGTGEFDLINLDSPSRNTGNSNDGYLGTPNVAFNSLGGVDQFLLSYTGTMDQEWGRQIYTGGCANWCFRTNAFPIASGTTRYGNVVARSGAGCASVAPDTECYLSAYKPGADGRGGIIGRVVGFSGPTLGPESTPAYDGNQVVNMVVMSRERGIVSMGDRTGAAWIDARTGEWEVYSTFWSGDPTGPSQ